MAAGAMTARSIPARALTGKPGQILALLVLAVLAGLLWIGVAQPLRELYDDRSESLDRNARALQRMTTLVETLPEWRARWGDEAAIAAPRPALFETASDSVAAAALQSTLQDIARDSGAAINSLEVLAVETRGQYRRIALRVAAEGGLPVLVELLRRFETASPAIVVDQLSLRGPGLSTRTQAPPLSASFVAIGFRAAGPTP
jgi:hypothetical protein